MTSLNICKILIHLRTFLKMIHFKFIYDIIIYKDQGFLVVNLKHYSKY